MARTSHRRFLMKASAQASPPAQGNVPSRRPCMRRAGTQPRSCLSHKITSGRCGGPQPTGLCGPYPGHPTRISRPVTEFSLGSELPSVVVGSSLEDCQPTGRSEKKEPYLPSQPSIFSSTYGTSTRPILPTNSGPPLLYQRIRPVSPLRQQKVICSALPLFVRFRQMKIEKTLRPHPIWVGAHRW